jgi:hypothetical protein
VEKRKYITWALGAGSPYVFRWLTHVRVDVMDGRGSSEVVRGIACGIKQSRLRKSSATATSPACVPASGVCRESLLKTLSGREREGERERERERDLPSFLSVIGTAEVSHRRREPGTNGVPWIGLISDLYTGNAAIDRHKRYTCTMQLSSDDWYTSCVSRQMFHNQMRSYNELLSFFCSHSSVSDHIHIADSNHSLHLALCIAYTSFRNSEYTSP